MEGKPATRPLSSSTKVRIRDYYKAGLAQQHIAQMFGISQMEVSRLTRDVPGSAASERVRAHRNAWHERVGKGPRAIARERAAALAKGSPVPEGGTGLHKKGVDIEVGADCSASDSSVPGDRLLTRRAERVS